MGDIRKPVSCFEIMCLRPISVFTIQWRHNLAVRQTARMLVSMDHMPNHIKSVFYAHYYCLFSVRLRFCCVICSYCYENHILSKLYVEMFGLHLEIIMCFLPVWIPQQGESQPIYQSICIEVCWKIIFITGFFIMFLLQLENKILQEISLDNYQR